MEEIMSKKTTIPPHEFADYTVHITVQNGGQGQGHGSGILTNLRTAFGMTKAIDVQVNPGSQPLTIEPDYPLIITCAHVSLAQYLMVETRNGDMAQAVNIVLDDMPDVSLLYPIQVDQVASFHKPAIIGDSDAVLIGQEAWAVGSPLDPSFKFSLTRGCIAYDNREAPINSMTGKYMTYLRGFQLDVSIKQGNSGGALFDENGHLIGMNYAGLMSQSQNDMRLNFSLHINDVLLVLKRMLKSGTVVRPGLQIGVRPIKLQDSMICNLTDTSGKLTTNGVFLEYVRKGSDSAKHFQQKDIILQVNGDLIKNISDFRHAIFKAAGKGAKVGFRIWRQGKEISFDLQVPDKQLPFAHMMQLDFMGMHTIDSFIDDGVTVVGVAPGTPAFQAGILPDMLIVGIEDPQDSSKFIEIDTLQELYDTIINDFFVALGKTAFYLKINNGSRTALAPIVVDPQMAMQIVAQLQQQPPPTP
jgi:S1-C subfamily serine protease